ncbi:methyltransferase family protein [endosymbiont of Ridgeia piscesae]|jgi:protein-S-isoprenylcysteine O-methyltransferase Ste14|nr:hypothetical protein [endosymbiont of Ridgeia piscesae]
MQPTEHLTMLALAWLAYFALHSLFASLGFKQRVIGSWPALAAWYRLLFNLLAVLLLIPPLALLYSWSDEMLWQWQGIGRWLSGGTSLAAIAGFFWSLRYYDSKEFIGLRQLSDRRSGTQIDQEAFTISPLHRFVRHPWYSLGLVIVWSQSMNGAYLLSAILITLYFVLGSRLEEQKLIAFHGDVYRSYCAKVPSLLPLPWKYLQKGEAAFLAKKAQK